MELAEALGARATQEAGDVKAWRQLLGAFLSLAALNCIFLVFQMLPNQSLPRAIATAYATNAVGAVTGIGRVCFAFGQGTSPVIAATLYTLHPSAAYAYWLVLQCLQNVVHLASGQPFFSDPSLGSNRVVPANPPGAPSAATRTV